MSYSIAVICEARADYETVVSLVDRLILDHHRGTGWITEESLDDYRTYCGLHPSEAFINWREIETLFKSHSGRPIRSQFMNGYLPSHEDEVDILRARQLLLFHSSKAPDGMIFLRDTDNEKERKEGLENAGRGVHDLKSVAIVVGVAHTKRECWHIAGFEPDQTNEQTHLTERERIEQLRSGDNLGFDPRSRSEELTAKHDSDKLSAKRVLKHLTQADPARVKGCLIHLSIDELDHLG